MVAVAMGLNGHASVAMRRKSGGSGRAARSFTSKHLVDGCNGGGGGTSTSRIVCPASFDDLNKFRRQDPSSMAEFSVGKGTGMGIMSPYLPVPVSARSRGWVATGFLLCGIY